MTNTLLKTNSFSRIESANTNLTVSTLAELLKYFDIRFSDFFARVEEKGREFTKK